MVGSGNQLQKHKKDPWSLGEREAKVRLLGEGSGGPERHRPASKRESARWALGLEGFKGWGLGEVLGKDLNRLFIDFMLMQQ